MCYHPFIFSSFPLFIWAFSFFMECFQNKTLEQGRKRETASETNIPPRSDTLWVKNEIASPNEKARFAVTPPNLSLRAKRSSLVFLVNVNTRTLKNEIAVTPFGKRLLRKRTYHLAVTQKGFQGVWEVSLGTPSGDALDRGWLVVWKSVSTTV